MTQNRGTSHIESECRLASDSVQVTLSLICCVRIHSYLHPNWPTLPLALPGHFLGTNSFISSPNLPGEAAQTISYQVVGKNSNDTTKVCAGLAMCSLVLWLMGGEGRVCTVL